MLATKPETKKKIFEILKPPSIDGKKSQSPVEVRMTTIVSGDHEKEETDESAHKEAPSKKETKKRPRQDPMNEQNKKKGPKLLGTNSSLTKALTVRLSKVDDTLTGKQEIGFTVGDGTVAKPTMTHRNRKDTYHEVISGQMARGRNYQSKKLFTKPKTTDKYTFQIIFCPDK